MQAIQHKGQGLALPESNTEVPQDRYTSVRTFSERICAPLEREDYVIQSMPDVSPPKWHLAHTTWFFETFLLESHLPDYTPFHARYRYLFNSYYNAVGDQFPRAQRGLLSRPTVDEVYAYRRHVDEHMALLLERIAQEPIDEIMSLITLGCHHEQQHQELLIMDIKHILGSNPLFPIYQERDSQPNATASEQLEMHQFQGGIGEIGFAGEGFHFDNERPRHPVLVRDFCIANRLITNGEYLAFMEDKGYERPELWLSDGWAEVQKQQWRAPLYWHHHEGQWQIYTLAGLGPVDLDEPVCHVSFYEADAYATWAGCRLPEESEWEQVANSVSVEGHFADSGRFHPLQARAGEGIQQLFGDVWEWTRSSYAPYPDFQPAPGAVGEYNGKFMCNQMVLRGGSCATPAGHIRATYRNFFYPGCRWQFSGIRLAE